MYNRVIKLSLFQHLFTLHEFEKLSKVLHPTHPSHIYRYHAHKLHVRNDKEMLEIWYTMEKQILPEW